MSNLNIYIELFKHKMVSGRQETVTIMTVTKAKEKNYIYELHNL